jgi:hypothetical protein
MKKIPLLALLIGALCLTANPAAAQGFAFTPSFPSGVDWGNATPDQISRAVYDAAKANPDQVVDIVLAALGTAKGTQRFPSIASSDGKQYVDPDNPNREGTIEDLAERIGNAAKQANPSMAPQIDAAIMSAVPTISMLPTSGGSGGSGGGGTGGSGGSVPLPSGFGGGGGGGTVSNNDSSGGGGNGGGGSDSR